MAIQSTRSRRLVGQLMRGEDCLDGLLSVAQDHAVRSGAVRIWGVLEQVQLAQGGWSGQEGLHRIEPRVQLLHGNGMLAEHDGKLDLTLELIIGQPTESGLTLQGGSCRAGRVVTCEFIIEALDDLILRRDHDAELGLPFYREALVAPLLSLAPTAPDAPPLPVTPGRSPEAEEPPARPSRPSRSQMLPDTPEHSTTPPKQNWADAIMASVRASVQNKTRPQEDEDDEPFRPMRAGDILEHQKFGRCVIQRVDQDQEYATVRLRNDRLVRLSLEVLRLRYTGEEGGHQVFSASPNLE